MQGMVIFNRNDISGKILFVTSYDLLCCNFSQLFVQEPTTKIDLQQCITDEVVPVSLGSSTEANTIELTTVWSARDSSRSSSNTNRFGSANS